MAHATVQTGLAVVTGAGSGIGRAVAKRLAAAGFAVAALDVVAESAEATASAIEAAGYQASALEADVSDELSVEAALDRAQAAHGSIVVLVNSAGILELAPTLELSLQSWRRVLEVNLTGSFICSKGAAKRMVASGTAGVIVNIASVHSIVPGRDTPHYDASKGGLWMLTKSMALELAPRGIRVNAVAPGYIRTALAGGPSPEYESGLVPHIPLARAGEPVDVAGAVAFLCSPEASYVTGSMIVVDGGMVLSAHT